MSSRQSPFPRATYEHPDRKQSIPDPDVESHRQEVIHYLKQVVEPVLGKDIVSLGMVRNLRIMPNYVHFRLYVGCHQTYLEQAALQALDRLDWCQKAYVQVRTIPGVKITLAVSSGKGGVGKSTTAVNLAAALSLSGARVGLLDADVYGPNVPHMLGLGQSNIEVEETEQGQRFRPLDAYGIKIMSVGLLAEPDHPLAWRGPILHKIITQFIHDVDWGELDYLLIDLPPGTGDAQITIIQESPICGVLMVTTPQKVALSDVRRSIHMFRGVGVPVLGVVENMSYWIQPDGSHTSIFGSGGGQTLAEELQTPLLGQIPIDPRISLQGDAGQPLPLIDPGSSVAQVSLQIAAALNRTFSFSSCDSPSTRAAG